MQTVYSQLRDEMLSLLAPKYLNGHRNAGVVFRRLWRTNPELVRVISLRRLASLCAQQAHTHLPVLIFAVRFRLWSG